MSFVFEVFICCNFISWSCEIWVLCRLRISNAKVSRRTLRPCCANIALEREPKLALYNSEIMHFPCHTPLLTSAGIYFSYTNTVSPDLRQIFWIVEFCWKANSALPIDLQKAMCSIESKAFSYSTNCKRGGDRLNSELYWIALIQASSALTLAKK